MTGRRGSIWTEGMASRAEARMKAFLKLAWAIDSVRADEARAELDPDRAHFEIGGDRLAAPDPAGDEHRDVGGDVGQDFLAQHAGRDRADVAAGLHPLDHQRVGARADHLLGQRQRRGEGDQLGATRLDAVDRAARGQPAGEHDVGHLVLGADVDQLAQLRVHGDEVDPERLGRARLGLGDLGIEQFGVHRPAGDHAEAAGIADRGDEVALADPAHRPAEDGIFGAEELGPAMHQLLQPQRPRVAMDAALFGNHAFAAHAVSPGACVEPERRVEHAHGKLHFILGDQHADLDFARADREQVDAPVGQRREHRRRQPRVGADADPDDRHLGDRRIGQQFLDSRALP